MVWPIPLMLYGVVVSCVLLAPSIYACLPITFALTLSGSGIPPSISSSYIFGVDSELPLVPAVWRTVCQGLLRSAWWCAFYVNGEKVLWLWLCRNIAFRGMVKPFVRPTATIDRLYLFQMVNWSSSGLSVITIYGDLCFVMFCCLHLLRIYSLLCHTAAHFPGRACHALHAIRLVKCEKIAIALWRG